MNEDLKKLFTEQGKLNKTLVESDKSLLAALESFKVQVNQLEIKINQKFEPWYKRIFK